jgi:hypothetical protein
MPGAQCTRSLACEVNNAHERSHHRYPGTPGIPCAMVLTAYFVLSPVSEFVLSPSSANMTGLKARSGQPASTDLTPATGARTTRLYRPRIASFVRARFVRSQAHENLPCNPRTRPTLPRPPHPAPRQ